MRSGTTPARQQPRDLPRVEPLPVHRSKPHRRRPIAPVEEGEGSWLISYADMMTLLFGFFVLVSAFSTPDAAKLERLKKATVEYLDAPYTEPNHGLAESLQSVLRDFKLEDDIKIISTDEGLSVTSRGTIFFESGATELRSEARDLLERVADVLIDRALDFKVFVEGHTDDAPVSSAKFPSNWELSSARASTVVRLLEERGFPHGQLRPLGLADSEPTVPNRDKRGNPLDENRRLNRRIVIRLQRLLVKPNPMNPVAAPPPTLKKPDLTIPPAASAAPAAPQAVLPTAPTPVIVAPNAAAPAAPAAIAPAQEAVPAEPVGDAPSVE